MNWVEQYILAGYTWALGANGPEAYDCWHFVRLVERERFGRELPAVAVEAGVARALLTSDAALAWRLRAQGEAARDGDIVTAHRPDDLHVGVWAQIDGGGMLHCNSTAGAPVWTQAQRLTEWFPRIEVWAYEQR